MATRSILIFIFLSSVVSVIYGLHEVRGKYELEEPTEEDCMRPPMRGHGHECCRVPKERIWGDLRSSIHKCLKKYKPGLKPISQEMAEEGDDQVVTSMDGPNEPVGTTPRPSDSPNGRPMKKPHRLPHHQNDSCFMECVFEDQGFLTNKLVNKFALLGRLDRTLEKNEKWHKVAVAAVEICSQIGVKIDRNTTCESGSEEIFRCIFKYLFFNCPSWSQAYLMADSLSGKMNDVRDKNFPVYTNCEAENAAEVSCTDEYCTSLKKFYEKCPNGPPPPMNDSHPTSVPEVMETPSTTESEKNPEE